MNISILYEDETLLVINKPPGIVVNNAQSVEGITVQDWAHAHLGLPEAASTVTPGDDFLSRAGIVHRIDKETSGCLVIAKTPEAFVSLQAQFKERTVKKTYLAVAHGIFSPEIGEIRAPVGRLPWNRERFGILPGGKDAVTRYRVLRSGTSHDTRISLVELYPETGRTHQIRVHLKYINHPIVGDWQYAGRKTARNDRVWAPRVMLHAASITLTHPITGASLAIEAEVPDDMKSII